MKVIIAGSRDVWMNRKELDEIIQLSGYKVTEVVSGGAPGIDYMGQRWAMFNNVIITLFRADWETYGKRAGPIRNRQMAKYADALICIHHNSPGSLNMIKWAHKYNLPTYIKVVK